MPMRTAAIAAGYRASGLVLRLVAVSRYGPLNVCYASQSSHLAVRRSASL